MSQENDHWGTLPEAIPAEFRPGSRPSWWNRLKRILGVPHKAGELPSIAVVEPIRPAPERDLDEMHRRLRRELSELQGMVAATVERKEDETIRLLRSIDGHLAKLASTVKSGTRHRTGTPSITTGHWND